MKERERKRETWRMDDRWSFIGYTVQGPRGEKEMKEICVSAWIGATLHCSVPSALLKDP